MIDLRLWSRRHPRHPLTSSLGLLAPLLIGMLLLTGCGGEPTGEEVALSADEFVEVMVALREAERESLEVGEDSAGVEFRRRKEEILAEHGVAQEDLRQFVVAHSADFELMEIVWDTIAQRLRYVPEPGDPEDPDEEPFQIERPR